MHEIGLAQCRDGERVRGKQRAHHHRHARRAHPYRVRALEATRSAACCHSLLTCIAQSKVIYYNNVIYLRRALE